MTGPTARFALERVEEWLDRALSLDPATRHALARLSARRLNVVCEAPPLRFGATFRATGRIALSPESDPDAEATLRGGALSLAMLAVNARDRFSLSDSGVAIEGDQELVRELGAILGNLDLDWEAALAELIGDIPAHLAGRAVRRANRWRRRTVERSVSGLGEYLREESDLALGRDEALAWFEKVRTLASDTDRLAARVRKLRERLGEH